MKISVFGTMVEVISVLPGEDGTCVVEVMCNSDRHKISLDPTGELTVHDHEEEEQTLSRVGDDEPQTTCMRVRKQLREWIEAGQIIC